jgi:hypothetical protein
MFGSLGVFRQLHIFKALTTRHAPLLKTTIVDKLSNNLSCNENIKLEKDIFFFIYSFLTMLIL